MLDSKRGLLPLRHSIHLSKTMSPKTSEEMANMAKVPYASAIGSLMYAMLCTGLDVAYAISMTSRFQSNPSLEHWVAVKDRKSTRLNSSHSGESRMPSSA